MSTPKTIRNTVMTTEVQKSEAEWRAELTPHQYDILRRKGTEPPFTGEYTFNDATGSYRCAACGSELFGSDSKFDSGTGWPSFTEPAIAAAVELRPDNGLFMRRTEVLCRHCGGHLGHEFTGVGMWLNSDRPVNLYRLYGEVVLIEFWSFGCINCGRTLPFMVKMNAS